MKKTLTLKQMSSMGGTARAKSLSKARRKELAVLAAMARWHGVPITVDKGIK
jgi:hypothetical protein